MSILRSSFLAAGVLAGVGFRMPNALRSCPSEMLLMTTSAVLSGIEDRLPPIIRLFRSGCSGAKEFPRLVARETERDSDAATSRSIVAVS